MYKKLNAAIIGVSGRGLSLMSCIYGMEDVKITVVCDLYTDRMEDAAKSVLENCGYRPDCCSDYREVVKRSDVDCVITPSSWMAHREIALASMRAGKPVGTEVGGAYSLHDCWELVKISEETGINCMMLDSTQRAVTTVV